MSKTFLCSCEDVPVVEVVEAIRAGYDDLESLRRFTAVGTGPCQGKRCMRECLTMLAHHHGVEPGAIGVHTMRPPLVPIPLGHLADLDPSVVEGLLAGPGIGQSDAGAVVAHGRHIGEGTMWEDHDRDQNGSKDDGHEDGSAERPVRGVVDDATYAAWAKDDKRRGASREADQP